MFPVFKNVGVRSVAHKYSPVGYPSVVSKTFKKFINNRLFYHLEKCDNFFFCLHYGFRSTFSTTDLLTVVTDKIARVFTVYSFWQGPAFWIVGVQVLGPISLFLDNEPLYGPCSGIGLWQATAALISLLSVVSKGFGKLVRIGFLITLSNVVFLCLFSVRFQVASLECRFFDSYY